MATPVVGIICEYDPFHRGHARQFQLVREKLPGASIVCVMSGPFTQRGMPALYIPTFRAKAALEAGADLVLELPALYALREAEHFALGGVSILHGLGIVTHLSFGCENENLAVLSMAADILEEEPPAFRDALQTALATGASFALAQGIALATVTTMRLDQWEGLTPTLQTDDRDIPKNLANDLTGIFSAPNNILAISYLRALRRLGSSLTPLPVLRKGSYHAATLEDAASEGASPFGESYPSATAVRAAILAGDIERAESACGYPLPTAPLCLPNALDAATLYQLRQMNPAQLAILPDCTEGLENRLYRAAHKATSRAELLSLLKTRRYPHARLSRLCTHALLGITAPLQKKCGPPSYVRLLGFRRGTGEALLRRLRRNNTLPLISKAASGPHENPAYALDIRAYDTWALGANQPAGLMFREQVQVVDEVVQRHSPD